MVQDHILVLMWTVQDVMKVGVMLGVTLSIEEANDILKYLDRHYNPETGITWSHIQHEIEALKATKP